MRLPICYITFNHFFTPWLSVEKCTCTPGEIILVNITRLHLIYKSVHGVHFWKFKRTCRRGHVYCTTRMMEYESKFMASQISVLIAFYIMLISGDNEIDIDEYTTVWNKSYGIPVEECREAFHKISDVSRFY